jgi:hypothetical protein
MERQRKVKKKESKKRGKGKKSSEIVPTVFMG